MESIQEAVNRTISTGAAFLLASAMSRKKRGKGVEQSKPSEENKNMDTKKMMESLRRRKEEAEQAKQRSEEFRKMILEGVPKEHNIREVIRYGN